MSDAPTHNVYVTIRTANAAPLSDLGYYKIDFDPPDGAAPRGHGAFTFDRAALMLSACIPVIEPATQTVRPRYFHGRFHWLKPTARGPAPPTPRKAGSGEPLGRVGGTGIYEGTLASVFTQADIRQAGSMDLKVGLNALLRPAGQTDRTNGASANPSGVLLEGEFAHVAPATARQAAETESSVLEKILPLHHDSDSTPTSPPPESPETEGWLSISTCA